MPLRGPAPAKSLGEIPRDGYIVEKLFVETLPGFHVGVNIYRPASGAGKRPGVLVAHGHWKNGRIEHTEDYSVPALCAALAVNGYVALAYDMAGYNDTRQLPHKFGDSDEERLWSFGPLSVQLWNSIRVLDYLAARPDVDPARLAITGASGGGTQTYLLAAVDDRIKVSIPAVMVSAKFQGNDLCEMAPGLRIGTNNVELAATVAPRPMLLLSSTRDWTSRVPTLEYPAIRKIYRLLGHPGRVESFQVDAGHGYNAAQRTVAIRFLGKHFAMPSGAPEPAAFKGPPEEFLIGPTTSATETVFLAWRRLLTRRNESVLPSQKVALLRELTGGNWPARVVFVAKNNEGSLRREQADGVVPARLVPGSPAIPVIAVHRDGRAAAERMKAVKAAATNGSRILLIDLFATANGPTPGLGRHSDHLVFHHSDDANRVQDILTAASWLAGQGAKRIRLACDEDTGDLCRLAAAIAPIELRVEVENSVGKKLLIPGLLAAGYPTLGTGI